MARGRGGWGELGRRGLVWVYIGWDMTEKKKETREEMRSDKGQKMIRVQCKTSSLEYLCGSVS